MSEDPKLQAIDELLRAHPEWEEEVLAVLNDRAAATASPDGPPADVVDAPVPEDTSAPPASIDNTVAAVDTTLGADPGQLADVPAETVDVADAPVAEQPPAETVATSPDLPPASIDNTVASDTTAGAPPPPPAVEPEPEIAPPGKPAISDILAQLDRAEEALGFARALIAEL